MYTFIYMRGKSVSYRNGINNLVNKEAKKPFVIESKELFYFVLFKNLRQTTANVKSTIYKGRYL